MSSRWTNNYEITVDLSLAQGCVPVNIRGPIRWTDKPPMLDHVEGETEDYSSEDVVPKPDLGLIKTMLDLQARENVNSEDDNFETIQIQIQKPKNSRQYEYHQVSELNPNVPEFKPTKTNTCTMVTTPNMPDMKPYCGDRKLPGKTRKNVAMESILHMYQTSIEMDKENTIVIAKPWDFYTKMANVKKVVECDNLDRGLNSGCTAKEEKTSPKRLNLQELMRIKPTAMFKRKSQSPAKSYDDSKEAITCNIVKPYTPSKWAQKYEKEYEERATLKIEMNKEQSIWDNMQKQLKELENKRKCELENAEILILQTEIDSQASAIDGKTSEDKMFPDVILPQPRHELPGFVPDECVVCEAVKTYQQRQTKP